MARPEHYRVKAMKKWLDECAKFHPLFYFRTHQTGKTKKGIPDLHVIFYGVALWIEAKKDEVEQPTEIQAKRIEDINKALAYSFCTSKIETIQAAMITVLHDNAGRLFCRKCRRWSLVGEARIEYADSDEEGKHPFRFCSHGCEQILNMVPAVHLAKFPKIPKARKVTE